MKIMQQVVIFVLAGLLLAADGLLHQGKDASAIQVSPEMSCNHRLSGVDDGTLRRTLAHEGMPVAEPCASNRQLCALQHQTIFIAACLHQSEAVMPHWTSELVRLLLALRSTGQNTSFFVSIYESGSKDHTSAYLDTLQTHLDFMGVPSNIVQGGEKRAGMQRIQFLADVRNKAMAPLRASSKSYDRVLWLSDNLFCADGVLQMLSHALPQTMGGVGADAVCGMDYLRGHDQQCAFYDTWVSHDIGGDHFNNERPMARQGEDKLESGQPFQVFSCWNGMVAFDADIFQKEKLFFRPGRENINECTVAETELIFRDMWNAGRGKIVVSPHAASAYNMGDFKKCAATKQPIEFDHVSPMAWKPAPEIVDCCPLQTDADFVQTTDCFKEHWNRFGNVVPRLSSSDVFDYDANAAADTEDQTEPGEILNETQELSVATSGEFDVTGEDVSDVSFLQLASLRVGRSLSDSYSRSTVPVDLNIHTHAQATVHLLGAVALLCFVTFAFISLRGHLHQNIEGGYVYVVVLFWMTMSLLMNLLNKQCTILVHCPFTLVLIQMLGAILILARTSLSGMKKKDLWRWSALALLFGLMLCSSMFAFTHASVTCLLVVRNCMPLFVLPVERAFLPDAPRTSTSMAMSLCVIGLGTVLYARFAPGFAASSTGLMWIIVNCLATVAHRVLERYLLTSDMRMSFEAMALINNVVPLLPVGALAWATGETQQWPQYVHLLHSPMAIVVLACSGIVGLCLGLSSIMVQKCVTATTMMVQQTSNKLFIILAAMFFFNDRFTPLSFMGCALSLLGCAAYGMAQHAAKQASSESRQLLPTLAQK